MEDINKINKLFSDFEKEIAPHIGLIPEFLKKLTDTDKPLSIYSVSSFFPKVESLRIGVFELAKINECYSINVLYRSLIEHYVKFTYIWMKTVSQNNSDEVGVDYMVFSQYQENIDYVKSLKQSCSLVGIDITDSPVEILKEMEVISDDLSTSKIKKRVEQFNYKHMTRFISDSYGGKESGQSPVLDSIFPQYSKLSSFVHGGPESTNIDYNESLNDIVEMAAFISLYVQWNIYILFYQYDKSFESLCAISKKYLDKLS